MLHIACPYCGLRDEDEFRCGGSSHAVRPALSVTDEIWADYLFNRENLQGIQRERWVHHFGCGRWFSISRHTVSHEILASYRLGEDSRPPDGLKR